MKKFKIRYSGQEKWYLKPGAGVTTDASKAHVYTEKELAEAFPQGSNPYEMLDNRELVKCEVVEKGIYPGWIQSTTEPLIQPNINEIDFNGMFESQEQTIYKPLIFDSNGIFNPTKEDRAYDTTFPSSMDDVTDEKPEFKETLDSINSLLEYKNKKYGNAALSPLEIFQGKCKVGQRLDDKLARVKNSDSLKKNDIADLIGYLTLACVENGWNNFDEFKD